MVLYLLLLLLINILLEALTWKKEENNKTWTEGWNKWNCQFVNEMFACVDHLTESTKTATTEPKDMASEDSTWNFYLLSASR